MAIEPVSKIMWSIALQVMLSFFNNLEEVVKRFTKAYLEMGV